MLLYCHEHFVAPYVRVIGGVFGILEGQNVKIEDLNLFKIMKIEKHSKKGDGREERAEVGPLGFGLLDFRFFQIS
jgi:hypothetical protein